MIDLLSQSFRVIEKFVGLVPTIKKAYYKRKFHTLHKKILEELRKPDNEKLDSVLDDYLDQYKLLLQYFSEEVKD